MNLLTLPLRLPLLPVQSVIRVAELVRDEAEQEWRDPAEARRRLEAAQEARQSGEISEEEQAQVEGEAVGRLVASPPADRRGGAYAE